MGIKKSISLKDSESKGKRKEDWKEVEIYLKELVGIFNVYFAKMLVRHSVDNKKYLYDILGIKKETSSPLEYILYGENPSLL